MPRSSIFILLVSLAVAAGARADVPDLNLCVVSMDPAAMGGSVVVVPDGSGSRFDQAFDANGDPVDATITLTIIDNNTQPVFMYPFEDVWLETSAGGLQGCNGGTTADQSTDVNGQTFWLQPLRAGGCSVDETVEVMIAGTPVPGGGVDLIFKSPDLNGDLQINLSDIVTFTQMIGAYQECADFNNDGVINLSDIVRFTPGIGRLCN